MNQISTKQKQLENKTKQEQSCIIILYVYIDNHIYYYIHWKCIKSKSYFNKWTEFSKYLQKPVDGRAHEK